MKPKTETNIRASKIFVEISQKPTSKLSSHDIELLAKDIFLQNQNELAEQLKSPSPSHNSSDTKFAQLLQFPETISPHIHRIAIYCPTKLLFDEIGSQSLNYRIFRLRPGGPCPDDIDEDSNERVNASSQWELPNEDFDEHWENLVFESGLKEELLSYADTLISLSLAKVNPATVSYNRLLLLHGPPGSGKTSLSRALAQKLSIRQSLRFKRAVLIEINSHSLFSRWFSESGKLVMKMFERIHCLLEDKDCFVYLLIDEVESLASSRKSAIAGSEPSDAIRVVNALLTQIDQLRRFPNVLLLTTSNLAESIDPAFLDRVDFLHHVGPPSSRGIHFILSSCVRELILKGVLPEIDDSELNTKLTAISGKGVGLSGRALRKLPVLAISACRKEATGDEIECQDFFAALTSLIESYKNTDSGLELKMASLLSRNV